MNHLEVNFLCQGDMEVKRQRDGNQRSYRARDVNLGGSNTKMVLNPSTRNELT